MERTTRQQTGDLGEEIVVKTQRCPGCKRDLKTLRRLPNNFKCADVICDFCGYLAQVKSTRAKGDLPESCPLTLMGAAYGPQRERMDAGIYFSMYVVVLDQLNNAAIFFLPRDMQTDEMFVERPPLKETARRAGWIGTKIDFTKALALPTRIH